MLGYVCDRRAGRNSKEHGSMRRRFIAPLVALALALTTGGVVLALTYPGEDVC